MIGFLVRGRARFKIRIRVRVRITVGVTLNVNVYHIEAIVAGANVVNSFEQDSKRK